MKSLLLVVVAVACMACDLPWENGISPEGRYLGPNPTRVYASNPGSAERYSHQHPLPGQAGYIANCTDEKAALHPTPASVNWIASHCS